MTRKEAVAVLEAFIENPLFSNTHKAAFNIAIHDIKQRHDWNINNLILINKENYEPVDREIFDKIRAEIEALPKTYPFINHIDTYVKEDDVKKIIDKYKAESEEEE